MNANKILDDLSCKLDSFNPAERKNALEEFKKAFVTAGESFVCEKDDNNMHCHTFFSFNGYGYSPTHVACWAKAERLFSAGLIDFDVLKRSHLRWGVIAQFFYNGGQTAINSLFLVYCCTYAGLPEDTATTFFGLYMLAFLLGAGLVRD